MDNSNTFAGERVIAVVQRMISERLISRPVSTDDTLSEAGLTSLDAVRLVLLVEDEFNIEIPISELTLANFRSISTISLLVTRLLSRTWALIFKISVSARELNRLILAIDKKMNRVFRLMDGITMRRTEIDRLLRYAGSGFMPLGWAAIWMQSADHSQLMPVPDRERESQASPVAIKAAGVEEFHPLLALLAETFKLVDLTTLSMIVEGAQATMHWRVNVRSRMPRG
jgi:acyl carrier protein